jgi:hypothetical protein
VSFDSTGSRRPSSRFECSWVDSQAFRALNFRNALLPLPVSIRSPPWTVWFTYWHGSFPDCGHSTPVRARYGRAAPYDPTDFSCRGNTSANARHTSGTLKGAIELFKFEHRSVVASRFSPPSWSTRTPSPNQERPASCTLFQADLRPAHRNPRFVRIARIPPGAPYTTTVNRRDSHNTSSWIKCVYAA